MSSAAWASWLDRLENARGQETMIAAKIRAGNVAAIGTSVFALQQSTSRLKRDFEQLMRSTTSNVTKQELDRRERLLRQLDQDLKNDLDSYNRRNSPAASQATREQPRQLLSMQNQIMKDQDQQLDLIGRGVSNLKNYSLTVKDETELHVRLLNDIDDDVSRATNGLESEGERAAKVARQSNNFKLYVIIIILFAILIFLLVAGS
uniref:t-SNARE coiled-coil homology domain-containing protein n=1 Tax=Globisporangium ultimum (strain ATCC 200006 / CBS 805.95 / DAOM BR144) TaxID=431595 RepID=K3WQ79_GLOUD